MDLRDYPRPKGDTGIGVHWNAGFPEALGLGQIRDVWLPELKALGVKWVKLTRHDGGLKLAELLLKHDIMPIVRVYRDQPNPGTLDDAALKAVSDYVSAGVRYLEFNNEPDLGVEWQGGLVPADALQIVTRNAIIDMEDILARGGYPGIPALATGTLWDIMGEIHNQGRRDLFREPIWQAIHNYSLNHPLDYPYDPGNQQGAPYQQEFYARLAAEAWDKTAWGDWSLERINAERRDHSNPGATAFDDPSCWRAYERYDQLIRDKIGRSLPILATENGYIVGERHDPRYPATTPQLHMAQTLEACRIMMGLSTRFDHAPDYYFCTAFWLLGNYALGHFAPRWENAAWYSERRAGGKLPIVEALKADPKQERTWRGDGGLAGHITGAVLNGADLTVVLARADGFGFAVRTDTNGDFQFVDLPLGVYTVTVDEAEQSKTVSLTSEIPAAIANFDLTGITIHLTRSAVRGLVRGGGGLPIRLLNLDTDERRAQTVTEEGSYLFAELPAGSYVLGLADVEIVGTGFELDGRNEIVIDLEAPGWGWEASDGGASPGFGIILCRVTGQPGVDVRLWTKGWAGMTRRTGSKPEYGPDVCEFAPLGAGLYSLQPDTPGLIAEIDLDGSRVEWVTFQESDNTPAQESVISGRVRGGSGRSLLLTGPGGPQRTTVAGNASYRFGDLPAGIYRLLVEDTEIGQGKIVLDGRNRTTVDLMVPGGPPDEPDTLAQSAIFGTVARGAGATLRLVRPSATEPLATTRADADGRYRFAQLPAGRYTLQVLAAENPDKILDQRSDIELDGENEVQIDLALPQSASGWSWRVEDGGKGSGSSVVRCQVTGRPDVQVHLATAGWSGITQRTGSKQEYGPDVCEFAPLGAGAYSISLEGLDVTAEVTVETNRVAWIRFTQAGETSAGGTPSAGTPAGEPPDPDSNPDSDSDSDSDSDPDPEPGPDPDPEPKPPAAPDKTVEHYLLIGNTLHAPEDFLAILRYVARFQPALGDDPTIARNARRVTILGDAGQIETQVEADLRASGCVVQRIEADYAQRLAILTEAGEPYEKPIDTP